MSFAVTGSDAGHDNDSVDEGIAVLGQVFAIEVPPTDPIVIESSDDSEDSGSDSGSKSGRKKRKRRPIHWSLEDDFFITEGYSQYGADWKAIAAKLSNDSKRIPEEVEKRWKEISSKRRNVHDRSGKQKQFPDFEDIDTVLREHDSQPAKSVITPPAPHSPPLPSTPPKSVPIPIIGSMRQLQGPSMLGSSGSFSAFSRMASPPFFDVPPAYIASPPMTHIMTPTNAAALLRPAHWSAQDDTALSELFSTFGPKWDLISNSLPAKSPEDCRRRWYKFADPMQNDVPFTPREDSLILTLQKQGNGWQTIADRLGTNRPGIAVYGRYLQLAAPPTVASPTLAVPAITAPQRVCTPAASTIATKAALIKKSKGPQRNRARPRNPSSIHGEETKGSAPPIKNVSSLSPTSGMVEWIEARNRAPKEANGGLRQPPAPPHGTEEAKSSNDEGSNASSVDEIGLPEILAPNLKRQKSNEVIEAMLDIPVVPHPTSPPVSPASLETNQTAQEPRFGTVGDLARENADLKRVTERLRAELTNRDDREKRLLETIEKQAKLIQSLRSITSVDDGNLCIRLLPLAKDNL